MTPRLWVLGWTSCSCSPSPRTDRRVPLLPSKQDKASKAGLGEERGCKSGWKEGGGLWEAWLAPIAVPASAGRASPSLPDSRPRSRSPQLAAACVPGSPSTAARSAQLSPWAIALVGDAGAGCGQAVSHTGGSGL